MDLHEHARVCDLLPVAKARLKPCPTLRALQNASGREKFLNEALEFFDEGFYE